MYHVIVFADDQADLLRRELDSRFLDRSGLAVTPTPPSSTYLRTDLQHQQHAHLHQHPQLLPPVSAPSTPLSAVQPSSGQIFPPPLFKDISKISSVDPQFYRTGMGLPPGGYSGYTSAGLLHSGLGGPTPFMPPNHLTSFAPKVRSCCLPITYELLNMFTFSILVSRNRKLVAGMPCTFVSRGKSTTTRINKARRSSQAFQRRHRTQDRSMHQYLLAT